MSDDGGASLSLDDVTQRFVDSEQALTQVKERLEALATAAERAESSQSALEESAVAVRSFVDAAGPIVEEMRGVQAQVRETLEAAADLVGGDALQELQNAIDNRLGKLEADVSRIWEALPTRWQNRAKR